MNTPNRPVFTSSSIATPRSLGYSYLPGNVLQTVTAPSPIRTFGSSASPQPGSYQIPQGRNSTSPQQIGSTIVNDGSGNSFVRRLSNALFS
jgi:hypothetical protein